MAVNYVDYEVLNTGKTVYANQAAAIMDIIDTINRMNGDLQQGWSNETARAFVERISSDPAKRFKRSRTISIPILPTGRAKTRRAQARSRVKTGFDTSHNVTGTHVFTYVSSLL